MDPNQVTQETVALIKQSQSQPNAELAKAWTQSGSAIQGITAYDLEAPAKKLYPVITPLRNRIPRVSGKGGIQANWRGITGINTGTGTGVGGWSIAGVSGGNRGGVISTTTANYIAAYAGLGLEDTVTFEADYAAETFDDVKALAVEGLLRSLMIQEEKVILGGNASIALGQISSITKSTSTAGGAITGATGGAKTIYYQVAPLTLEGYLNASVANGVPKTWTRTNADGSTETIYGGSGKASAEASQACGTATDTNTVNLNWAAVNGAVAYAVYWDTTSASEKLGAIVTINSYVITSNTASGTDTPQTATDCSQNSLVFDGLLSQIFKSGSNAYVAVQPTGTVGVGTPLTADSAGGIVEIDAALKSFWDNYRLSPTDIYVNAQELMNISKKVLGATSTSAQRFTFNVDQGVIAGGTLVRSYLNKFAMDGAVEIPIRLHPNLPAGTILFYCDRLPYPLSNVTNVVQVRTRRDYYQIEWPLRSRKYEYGIYCDEVLQNYFTPAFGVITNVANG
jgi:hypothetical protein